MRKKIYPTKESLTIQFNGSVPRKILIDFVASITIWGGVFVLCLPMCQWMLFVPYGELYFVSIAK